MTPAALVAEDVTFTYPEAERPALRDVEVEIPEGAFALVAGATGAGKSTFLRTANGLVPHFTGGRFEGRVLAAGRDTIEHPPRRLADVVAFVPQDPAASFVLDRVEDEVAYGMENLGMEAGRMRRRVEEVLDLLGLAELRHRSVRAISGGERQRVAIAAALVTGARILVLDEPTSQLDPQGAEDVMAALQRLVHDHGVTVLLAEHRLERVAGWVDLAVGVEEGAVRSGAPATVLRAIGAGPPVARLGRLLGWEPEPLTVREARALVDARVRTLVPPAPVRPSLGPEVVRAAGLVARYGDEVALRDVDLSVAAGEVVAVMGRNGAGKSTLLRCIAGVHEPASGAVTISGRPPRPGLDVGLAPQDPDAVLFTDRVDLEVAVTLRARGLDPAAAAPLLERLGIGDRASRHPRDLSAGERLLVATAAIAATGAPVLLLDEPTRGLDPSSKERLAGYLASRSAVGEVSILATHDVELAASVATRVVMLAQGEVVADGPTADVLGDSQVFAPQVTRVLGAGWLTPEQAAEAIA